MEPEAVVSPASPPPTRSEDLVLIERLFTPTLEPEPEPLPEPEPPPEPSPAPPVPAPSVLATTESNGHTALAEEGTARPATHRFVTATVELERFLESLTQLQIKAFRHPARDWQEAGQLMENFKAGSFHFFVAVLWSQGAAPLWAVSVSWRATVNPRSRAASRKGERHQTQKFLRKMTETGRRQLDGVGAVNRTHVEYLIEPTGVKITRAFTERELKLFWQLRG